MQILHFLKSRNNYKGKGKRENRISLLIVLEAIIGSEKIPLKVAILVDWVVRKWD